MTALGMVMMVIGGLLLLSTTRSYMLYRANRRQPATRAAGDALGRMLAGMLIIGVMLAVAGATLAFS